ncbi:MAG: DNA helicase RecQ [Thiofilum sp.]|uniref:DNA helicase RecQ n=1 Tax=Thiofilum sp. TaxID=2212733 RepID=UPI0025E01501|nr:DNA helicase RecQ [Thiofilum sp.]MBK8452606.1 DNA helicase RecQ [Thiofilum sp.]
MQRAYEILEQVYGYSAFRPPQAEIINTLLQGKDALALMPTGGGKSLCYQIPALIRAGVGVIVSPLIALMQDQVSALKQLGVRAAFLNSTLNLQQVIDIERSLKAQQLDLLYVAPERLLMERTLTLLDQLNIALFAIDEAHCVSQWGHDFRPEYQKLSQLVERYPQVPRIALTATADPRTRQEIITQLSLEQAKIFAPSFDRPNIQYAIHDLPNAKQALWDFIRTEHRNDAGIVYCLSRKRVEEVAAWLSAQGRTALPYHAGLEAEVRQRNQERFLREDGIIMVATIAFGMGIDKPDVRFVAHLNLPKSIEAYYQETGRAGRDGEPAHSWMSYGLGDVITLRQMLAESTASEQHKRVEHYRLDAMLALCEMSTCRRQALLSYLGETGSPPCGNCDNCLNPPKTWDATVAAQKALSCVYRTGQRFGVNYLIEVLLGKRTERIVQFNHHQVSTFGIGTDQTEAQWRSIYRQLLALGYLSVDLEGHGGLQLTELARPLLKGQSTLHLKLSVKPDKKAAKAERERLTKQALTEAEQPLWEGLRNLRMRLAQAQNVPPFAIFHDSTLLEMVKRHPHTLAELRRIHGVGEYKFEHYGGLFLEVLQAYPRLNAVNGLSETINTTLSLHHKGHSPERIAQLRELKLSTIYSHLAEAIEVGALALESVVQLDGAELQRIISAFDLLDENTKALSPIYEALEQQYSYEILKCVRASLGR